MLYKYCFYAILARQTQQGIFLQLILKDTHVHNADHSMKDFLR